MQITHLHITEGPQLSKDLLEFNEHPVPDTHRRRSVHYELQECVGPRNSTEHRNDQPARTCAEFGGRRLVQGVTRGRHSRAVALQRA